MSYLTPYPPPFDSARNVKNTPRVNQERTVEQLKVLLAKSESIIIKQRFHFSLLFDLRCYDTHTHYLLMRSDELSLLRNRVQQFESMFRLITPEELRTFNVSELAAETRAIRAEFERTAKHPGAQQFSPLLSINSVPHFLNIYDMQKFRDCVLSPTTGRECHE